MVCLLAVIIRSTLDEIITGLRADCQEQMHSGKRNILLEIIVGTIVLKACTSIIAFIKVAPPSDLKRLFHNYWILLSLGVSGVLFVTRQRHPSAIRESVKVQKSDINNAKKAADLSCTLSEIPKRLKKISFVHFFCHF